MKFLNNIINSLFIALLTVACLIANKLFLSKNLARKFFILEEKYEILYKNFSLPAVESKGSIFDLENFNIDCQEGIIQGFYLVKEDDNNISYKYECLMSKLIKRKKKDKKQTSVNKLSEGQNFSLEKLQNLVIECENDYALQQFRLLKVDENSISFEYTCVQTYFFSYKHNCQLNKAQKEFRNLSSANVTYNETMISNINNKLNSSSNNADVKDSKSLNIRDLSDLKVNVNKDIDSKTKYGLMQTLYFIIDSDANKQFYYKFLTCYFDPNVNIRDYKPIRKPQTYAYGSGKFFDNED